MAAKDGQLSLHQGTITGQFMPYVCLRPKDNCIKCSGFLKNHNFRDLAHPPILKPCLQYSFANKHIIYYN